jgi:short-subunit dehydrogenase
MITPAQYGPWAVIPGGSEGLGAAYGRLLGKAGINVVLVARRPEPLEAVAKDVRATGVQVRTLSCELDKPDMLDRIRSVTDDIDVGLLVYNAGAQRRVVNLLDGSMEDALSTVRLNAIGQVTLAHHFGSKMIKRKKGGIIICGSFAGCAGGATTACYAGSKAFSQMFAEGIWAEMKPHGVDVVNIVYGAMDTPAMERLGVKFKPGEAAAPEDMAKFGLDNIKNGPVAIPPAVEEPAKMFWGMPRRNAAETMTQILTGIK